MRLGGSSTTVVRAGLIALGATQTFNGLYALLAPRSFFDDFPAGLGWVAALPAYSEHLVRDVGSLFVATGVLLLAAAWYMDRLLVRVSLATFLLFSVPHTTFHVFNLEPYGTGDAIANVVLLGSQVLVPIALLVIVARSRPA